MHIYIHTCIDTGMTDELNGREKYVTGATGNHRADAVAMDTSRTHTYIGVDDPAGTGARSISGRSRASGRGVVGGWWGVGGGGKRQGDDARERERGKPL